MAVRIASIYQFPSTSWFAFRVLRAMAAAVWYLLGLVLSCVAAAGPVDTSTVTSEAQCPDCKYVQGGLVRFKDL